MEWILIHIVILVLSLFLLIMGAEWLLKGAVALAEKFHISRLAVASTIIAFGMSLPTIAVGLALLFVGGDSLNAIAGNTIGTNYVNVGLALGIPAFLVAIKAKYALFEKEIPLFFAVMSLLVAFSLDAKISKVEGWAFILVYMIVMFIMYQYSLREKVHTKFEEEMDVDTSTINRTETSDMTLQSILIHLLVGVVVLIGAAIVLAQLTTVLANDWNISVYIIGLTVVGIGNSLPTIVTSIRSARKGYLDIVLGNVFGGSIANTTLGLGFIAVLSELNLDAEAVSDVYYFSIFGIIVLFLTLIEMKLLGDNKSLSRISGIVIVSIYVIYLLSKFI